MFRSCLPGLGFKFDNDEEDDENIRDGNKDNGANSIRSILKLDPSTGALRIPSYVEISRADICPLLRHAWGQDWGALLRVCAKDPAKTLHVTKHSGRTALHLATFDRRCPLSVARALLRANRHMIAVRDSNHYTPLHILAFFSASSATNSTLSSNDSNDDNATTATDCVDGADSNETEEESKRALAEAGSVMSLFCDTAIMVEQELGRAREEGQHRQFEKYHQHNLLVKGSSPLYLAAKKGAHLSILKILLDTRSRTGWIAPSTGGEPYWYESGNHIMNHHSINRSQQHGGSGTDGTYHYVSSSSSSFSSPLEILLREDRLRSTMNASYYRNEARLLGEEEDGNLVRNRGLHSRPASTSLSRRRGRSRRPRRGSEPPRSPLHPDEILGAPHLIRVMRELAIDRCLEKCIGCDGDTVGPTSDTIAITHNAEQCVGQCDDDTGGGNSKFIGTNTATAAIASVAATAIVTTDPALTESQQRCLELWEKCIELLVQAGGGGIPRLMMEIEEDGAAAGVAATDRQNEFDEKGNHSRSNTDDPVSSLVPYGILHACVCCKVPVPSLVEIALILFPEQVYQRDVMHGMTPLHHVLRAEHRYSYATSNLLSILLHGSVTERGTVGAWSVHNTSNRSSLKANHPIQYYSRRQLQREESGNSAEVVVAGRRRLPLAPSLSNLNVACTSNNNSSSSSNYVNRTTASTSQLPCARYFQATALVPFPAITGSKINNGSHTGTHEQQQQKQQRQQQQGPIPLLYAISLGLPMEGVVHKLLEANSYESLRTIDPVSQLPPFALVATKVRPSEGAPRYRGSINGDFLSYQSATNVDTADTRALTSNKDCSHDILASAISCTINALSAGDGDSSSIEGPTKALSTTKPSVLHASSLATSSSRHKSQWADRGDSTYVYRLDDIYRLLLAHPQVLAQYIAVE